MLLYEELTAAPHSVALSAAQSGARLRSPACGARAVAPPASETAAAHRLAHAVIRTLEVRGQADCVQGQFAGSDPVTGP